MSLKLKSNDTRSITKSQGSSKEFLNEKAQNIERERETRLICSLFCFTCCRRFDIFGFAQNNLERVSLVCFNHREW